MNYNRYPNTLLILTTLCVSIFLVLLSYSAYIAVIKPLYHQWCDATERTAMIDKHMALLGDRDEGVGLEDNWFTDDHIYSANQMSHDVYQVIDNQPGFKLASLERTDDRSITADDFLVIALNHGEQYQQVDYHLSATGSYQDLLSFFDELSHQPIYWKKIDMKTAQYPSISLEADFEIIVDIEEDHP